MKKNKNMLWFYPFALFRLSAFEDYLTRMYRTGYQPKKMYLGFIILFEPVTPKERNRFVVLTRYFYINMKREKWNDAEFLRKINPKFNKGSGLLFDVYSHLPSTVYEIRLISVAKDEDVIALREHRKNRLFRINTLKFIELAIIVAGIILIVAEVC